jgi:hypothetical protein
MLGRTIRSLAEQGYQFGSEKTKEGEKLSERAAVDMMDDILEGVAGGVSEERIAKWLMTRLLTIVNIPSGSKVDKSLLDEELLFLHGVRSRFGWSEEFLSKIAAPIIKDMTANTEKAQEFFDLVGRKKARVN